jgi:putative nucleotidyltransferase with HDIG domain
VQFTNNQNIMFVRNITKYKQSFSHELTQAYDKTIEGWSRALYLRDHETEDHTRRVTEMALNLARQIGISDLELIHIRRGATLHDIGKVAIPDHILFKPGPLTEKEWAIMRRHPLIAVEILKSILYLAPALSIPRSHHEKWDGSGYPDGLAGENIPLTARIFAFADVFDALTSDRPYRQAWPAEDALEYIRKNSGTHFDPQIVSAFIGMF